MEWTDLPDLGPQSMVSDWRIVSERLTRLECRTCGLSRRGPTAAMGEVFYRDYLLYATPPGAAREDARQRAYAGWIDEVVGAQPASLVDVGCGNGSLLRALRAHWPETEMSGYDPSPAAVEGGSGPDLRLCHGSARDVPSGGAAVVVSINVIEHTADPVSFLRDLRRAASNDGVVVVVCPDGSRPGVELLMTDHLFSLAPAHLAALAGRAGLEVTAQRQAAPSLGDFQMMVARPSGLPGRAFTPGPSRIGDRRAYLNLWRRLDERLLPRVSGEVVCFGAGEAAGLLRAYAPLVWRQVRACTFDDAPGGRFGALPVIPLDAVRREACLLLGVRQADQPSVAKRFESVFRKIVTWHDLVVDEHEY